jgi:hypothetical protein
VAHTRAQLAEHIRRLFRLGGADAAARHAWLDTQGDQILAADLEEGAGGRIASTSAHGASVAFAPAPSRAAQDALGLIATLRPYADAPTLAAALAVLPPRVTATRPDFSGLTN